MKKFRVGYYVEVEVEAGDAVDAIHVADGALGWWERPMPFRVIGTAMGKRVDADVRRINQLFSHVWE